MNQPQISVIVPVYNVEKYLSRCIESILSQTFTDFELLLIDDGSTDRSGEICDEYAKKDTRIRVFHKENSGVSAARNLGLDNAKGEWISFVDSDDWVENDYLEKLIQGKNFELIFVGIQSYNNTMSTNRILANFEKTEIYVDDINIENKIINNDLLAIGFCWGKLYKKFILTLYHIRFNESISNHEDHIFYFDYLLHCKNIYLSNAICYNYTFTENSSSLSHTLPQYRQLIAVSNLFLEKYPYIFSHLHITNKKYIKRIVTEYGLGTRRAAIYSLYYYKENYKRRISFFKKQSKCFRNIYLKYGYRSTPLKHLIIILFVSIYLSPFIKDFILKIFVYRQKNKI